VLNSFNTSLLVALQEVALTAQRFRFRDRVYSQQAVGPAMEAAPELVSPLEKLFAALRHCELANFISTGDEHRVSANLLNE